MRRRVALLMMFAAVAEAEAGRLIRGSRSGSPPPPPPPAGPGPVPASPLFLEASGSTSGAKTIVWQAPEVLVGGSAISGDPVTSYTVIVRRTDTSAQVGTATVSAPTLTATISGLPATTMRATATATNSAGESNESLPVEWVGT